MAINKTINKSTKSHGAMRNCMEYVLKESKIGSGLVMVTGPFDSPVINYDTVYRSFLTEKRIWNKDSGRMYAHNIISWHKDEDISLEEAFDFGVEFASNCFEGFQTLIAVHQDRDHIHVHLVTNTVSYEDGRKLHNTRKDLERMKQLTNEMCIERGLSVASKGKNFHGEDLEEGHIRAWSKDKYHLLANESKNSYLTDCGLAVLDSLKQCESKEQFIGNMKKRGWNVMWKDSRKNITFENEEGKKVRDKNLSKTFNLNITKEGLLNEFERQSKVRIRRESDDELERYCREVEAIIGGDYGVAETGEDKQCEVKEPKSEVTDMWLEDSRKEASNVKYYKRKLEEEERHSNWMSNHIRELEVEICALKNHPWWKWIWNDIKPKRKFDYNYYTKEYRKKEFLGKVFRVSLAVVYAVGVMVMWWNCFVI